MLAGVLFDLDNTLLDHAHAEAEAARVFYRLHRHELDGAEPDFPARWREVTQRHYDRYSAGELTMQGQRRARLHELFARRAPALTDAEADRYFAEYYEVYRRHWRAFPDVAACLDALAGLALGVVTNGDPAQQAAKLAAIGHADRFRAVIASGGEAWAKPDARIFRHACDRLGVNPATCLFVGDHPDTDVRGALAAGLPAAWLNRAGLPAPDDWPAGAAILPSLATVPALVANGAPDRVR